MNKLCLSRVTNIRVFDAWFWLQKLLVMQNSQFHNFDDLRSENSFLQFSYNFIIYFVIHIVYFIIIIDDLLIL